MKEYEDFENNYDENFNLDEENELTDFEKIALYYKKRKIIKWSIIAFLGIIITSFIVITILALTISDPEGQYVVQNDFDNIDPSEYFPD